MTKDEIKKALTCCSNPSISYCKDCPYANYGEFDCCNGKMCKDALDLIIEQEREIERLKAEVKQAQIDILNELKERAIGYTFLGEKLATETDIDGLIEEVEKYVRYEPDEANYIRNSVDARDMYEMAWKILE